MTTTTADTEARRSAPRRAIPLARVLPWIALLSAGAYYAVFIARSSFSFQGRTYFALFDDAMISMRYARNLAEGHGLVWNAGQHIEGYSNFLWTLWMSAIHLLGLPDRLTSLAVMISAAAVLVLNLLVVRRLCALLVPGRPLVGVLAMVMTGLYYPLVFWALRGMEVGLAALLVSLAALLVLEISLEWSDRRCWMLAAVLGAAVLTRDDLFVPCVVVLAYAAWQLPHERRRRMLLIVGGTVAAVIAGHEIFRLAYYGDALPNTYYLKLGGISIGDRLARGGESLLWAGLFSLSTPLVFACAALALRQRARRAPLLLLGALFAAQCAYCVYVGGDAWEDLGMADRYIATAAPMLMVLAAVGIHETIAAAARASRAAVRVWMALAGLATLLLVLRAIDTVPHDRLGFGSGPSTQIAPGLLALAAAIGVGLAVALGRRPGRTASWQPFGALALALIATAAVSAQPVSDWLRSGAADTRIERLWTAMGVVIRQSTAPGTPVVMGAAGNIAYFDRRPGIDLLGKMDAVVANGPPTRIVPIRYRPGHNKWNYAHSIGRTRPPVVAALWWPTARDLCDVARWGYRQVAPRFYVRRGARGVDTAHLAAWMRSLSGAPGYPPPAPGCV